MKAINIRVEHLKAPLGLENDRPLISWNADEGICQSAYSYTIRVNNETVYVSEKIRSSEMSFLSPVFFHDRDEADVTIILYDENDEAGEEVSLYEKQRKKKMVSFLAIFFSRQNIC